MTIKNQLRDLSLDQIGAILQEIATELDVRGNAGGSYAMLQLWAFNEIEEVARTIRKVSFGELVNG